MPAETSATWGRLCFIFHRRTTGTEAKPAPCRSNVSDNRVQAALSPARSFAAFFLDQRC
jgi:hypothetical protein